MTIYRSLGKGVTVNGVAVMTKETNDNGLTWTDCNGYTGVGRGKMNLIATVDNPITSNSVQSEVYEIFDAIFYDDGLSGTNTKWDTNLVTKSLESNGTKFLCTSTSSDARASMNPFDNSSVFDFDPQPMLFECDLVDFSAPSGSIGMQFVQNGGTPNKQIDFQSSDIGHTIKLVYNGATLTKYVDDVAQANPLVVTYTDKIRVGFAFYAQDGYIIVKNVKAYPLSILKPTNIDSIDISVDNPILSFADSTQANPQIATLTATVNPIISGKTVQIFKDDVLVATETTDIQGQVSYEYTSQGVGDVIFTVECMNLRETFVVEDCYYYNPHTLVSATSFNVSLPSTFELEYTLKWGSSSNSAPYIDIGNASNDRMLIGQYRISGDNGLIIYKSTQTKKPYPTQMDTNGEHKIWFKYDGTKYYYKLDDREIMEVADANVTLSKLIHMEESIVSSNYIKDLKIKALYSIDVSVNNPVLSFADSTQESPQTATLTATVNPIEQGKTVKIYQDDVLVATETTDNQGQVSYEYTSQGIGYVEFEFKCGSVSETYTIQDIYILS